MNTLVFAAIGLFLCGCLIAPVLLVAFYIFKKEQKQRNKELVKSSTQPKLELDREIVMTQDQISHLEDLLELTRNDSKESVGYYALYKESRKQEAKILEELEEEYARLDKLNSMKDAESADLPYPTDSYLKK